MNIVLPIGGSIVKVSCGQLLIGAPQFSHFPQRMERAERDLHISAAVHGDDGDAFIPGGFGEGVFERTAAIAYPPGIPQRLGAVKMAERHIVEIRHQGQIHLIGPSHRQLFRVAALSTGHELMGHQDVPL